MQLLLAPTWDNNAAELESKTEAKTKVDVSMASTAATSMAIIIYCY